jgi:hypothetical protein
VTVAYTAPFGSSLGIGGLGSPTDPRPEQIAQVRPGIFYVDFIRISDDDFNAAADQLAAADGVVFDMRSYPFSLDPDTVISHLIDKPVTSNRFNIPIVTRPEVKAGVGIRSTASSRRPPPGSPAASPS